MSEHQEHGAVVAVWAEHSGIGHHYEELLPTGRSSHGPSPHSARRPIPARTIPTTTRSATARARRGPSAWSAPAAPTAISAAARARPSCDLTLRDLTGLTGRRAKPVTSQDTRRPKRPIKPLCL